MMAVIGWVILLLFMIFVTAAAGFAAIWDIATASGRRKINRIIGYTCMFAIIIALFCVLGNYSPLSINSKECVQYSSTMG
jgi:hypothetical protein